MQIRTRYLVAVIVVILVVATAYAANGNDTPRTTAADRATQRSLSNAPAQVRAEGRVATYPGATVTVGAETGGHVTRVLVHEQQMVHKGDVIAELAADEDKAALAEAKSRVTEANANIAFLSENLQRISTLAQKGNVSRQTLDKSNRDLTAAQAQHDVAQATVQRIEAHLAKLRIVAPISGMVTARMADPGETLAPGAPVATISDFTRRRVEAEVDEFDAGRIVVGAPATITAEGYDGQSWNGTVEVVPNVVVPRQLRPQDPGRPSDTRVLLVKITLPEDAPLKLYQRVEVSITPRKQ
jgi:RND family efflux transporter MFP subunit